MKKHFPPAELIYGLRGHAPENRGNVVTGPIQYANKSMAVALRPYSYLKADLEKFQRAVEQAKSSSRPRRSALIDLYEIAMEDAHLTAVISKRIYRVTGSKWKVVDSVTGEELPEVEAMLDQGWFYRWLALAMESHFYEYSLVAFDLPVGGSFPIPRLIPRENVIPEHFTYLQDVNDSKEISFTEPPYSPWLIYSWQENDLGLLKKAYPLTVVKKWALQAWSEYSDVFGQPTRVAKHNFTDEGKIKEIYDILQKAGRALSLLLPMGVDFDIIPNGSADAHQIFDKLVERCNSELSKLVEGSTMTTDDGSSLSQSQVHERSVELSKQHDLRWAATEVNGKILDLMRTHGMDVPFTACFMWDDKEELTKAQQWAIDQGILAHFDVDPEYIISTYGVPVTAKKTLLPSPEPTPGSNPKQVKAQSRFKVFASGINKAYHCPSCAGIRMEVNPDDSSRISSLLQAIAERIFSGDLPENLVPQDLALGTGELLQEAALEDFKSPEVWDTVHQVFLDRLRNNNFQFGAAKTRSALKQIREALLDDNGKCRSRSDFRQAVLEIDQTYNGNWLKTEYNHAQLSAQGAANYLDALEEEESFPLLEYSTAGDSRVRPAHQLLDGIVRPIRDSFWNSYYPPNGWGCRCDVIQRDDSVTPTPAGQALRQAGPAVSDPMFLGNPALTGEVWTQNHPYFTSARLDLSYSNYGLLPLASRPSSDLAVRKLSREEFDQWAEDFRRDDGLEFEDKDGLRWVMPKGLADFNTVREVPEILASPDEVWSQRNGSIVTTHYLKFYNDQVLLVKTESTDQGMVILQVTNATNDHRTGILIHG